MKAVSFAILVMFLTSLASASVNLCPDRIGPQTERVDISQSESCNDFEGGNAFDTGCCGEKSSDPDHDCGSCPCLCHAVAVAPSKLILSVASSSSPAHRVDESAPSIRLFRIERPPRLS